MEPAGTRPGGADRDAVRVQVAALVAQQAALAEDEARLRQRLAALERQEGQLAAHLARERARLVALRDDTQAARRQLADERVACSAAAREAERLRTEAAELHQAALAERGRLRVLRGRLKHRWHRHWAAERAALDRREALAAEAACRLDAERRRLVQARLKLNGDAELTRRELRAAAAELSHARDAFAESRRAEARQHAERQRQLEADAVALAEERRRWELGRRDRQQEAADLENRILGLRRHLAELGAAGAAVTAPTRAGHEEGDPSRRPTGSALVPAHAARAADLAGLGGALADQRLHLAEQWARLAVTRAEWEADCAAAAERLSRVAHDLRERERALDVAAQRGAAMRLDAEATRRLLRAWEVRLGVRAQAWEAERDRWLAEASARDHLAERRLEIAGRLRRRWQQHFEAQLAIVRAERAACARLGEAYAACRNEWARRVAAVRDQQRAFARILGATERCGRSLGEAAADPAGAHRRLVRACHRWAAELCAAEARLAEASAAAAAEAARIGQAQRQAEQTTMTDVATEEALRAAAREETAALAEAEIESLRAQVCVLTAERDLHGRQADELRAELERVVRALLDEAAAPADIRGRAA